MSRSSRLSRRSLLLAVGVFGAIAAMTPGVAAADDSFSDVELRAGESIDSHQVSTLDRPGRRGGSRGRPAPSSTGPRMIRPGPPGALHSSAPDGAPSDSVAGADALDDGLDALRGQNGDDRHDHAGDQTREGPAPPEALQYDAGDDGRDGARRPGDAGVRLRGAARCR